MIYSLYVMKIKKFIGKFMKNGWFFIDSSQKTNQFFFLPIFSWFVISLIKKR